MAGEGRNLVGILFKNIWNSLKPRRFRGDLIGQDYLGNKYYEIPEASRRTRWFDPPGGLNNFDNDMPAEWEAWLRGRRKDPPTLEEIQKSLNLMTTKKQNAEALEKEYGGPRETAPPAGKVPFPKLEGFEIYPGKKEER